METILSNNQKKSLLNILETEFLKRGFNVKIIISKEIVKKECNRFTFETNKFQTTPVLFKEIYLSDFGGRIEQEKDDERGFFIKKIWINVSAHYEHFDSGRNISHLFNLNGVFYDENYDLKKISII